MLIMPSQATRISWSTQIASGYASSLQQQVMLQQKGRHLSVLGARQFDDPVIQEIVTMPKTESEIRRPLGTEAKAKVGIGHPGDQTQGQDL